MGQPGARRHVIGKVGAAPFALPRFVFLIAEREPEQRGIGARFRLRRVRGGFLFRKFARAVFRRALDRADAVDQRRRRVRRRVPAFGFGNFFFVATNIRREISMAATDAINE